MVDRFVVISGCSGGGKSTLLEELKLRGRAVIEEPGRRIVAEERRGSGLALPWVDAGAFARRAVDMALADRAAARSMPGLVFFDRGLIDAAAALEDATGEPALAEYAPERYNRHVFMTPPWPEIHENDRDRQHGLNEAIAEYERLLGAYSALSYNVEILPKIDVERRADLVLARLETDRG